jgi:hypothetical protein
LPFHVAITDEGLEITARIKNEGDAENLIQIQTKPIFSISTDHKRPLSPSTRSAEYRGSRAAHFEASMTPQKEAETGMSFIITKTQKAELRRRGYTEKEIREMKSEDAHRALGLGKVIHRSGKAYGHSPAPI